MVDLVVVVVVVVSVRNCRPSMEEEEERKRRKGEGRAATKARGEKEVTRCDKCRAEMLHVKKETEQAR